MLLKDITLAAVTSIKYPETISALKKCSENISFGAIKIISPEKPDDLPNGIIFEKSFPISNIDDYNLYVFKNLSAHIDTEFCLLIQYDSWIIHPELWNSDWLSYDYIGAPWAIRPNAYICYDTGEHVRVGNGGFSLRSKKLLDIPEKYNLPLLQEQGWYNEDGNICVYHRKKMLELGVNYAPVEVAAKFSYENPVLENFGLRTFGFHKNYPHDEVLLC